MKIRKALKLVVKPLLSSHLIVFNFSSPKGITSFEEFRVPTLVP